MNKKILSAIITFLFCLFAFNLCLATDNHPIQDAANSVRNVVGGAENVIENGVKDIGNATKNGTNSVEGAMNSAGDNIKNTTNNFTSERRTNDDTYTAQRTSTNAGSTFMGMNSTVWTWLIIGIAAIAIVALVWYYSMQITNNSNNRHS